MTYLNQQTPGETRRGGNSGCDRTNFVKNKIKFKVKKKNNIEQFIRRKTVDVNRLTWNRK
jgi:hypothetical protein